MPVTGTVKAVTYKKITTAGAEQWDIDPFDLSGNLVSEMVIEVDSTLGTCTLNLPSIASFNNFWNTKITVVALTGSTNSVKIVGFADLVAVPPVQNTIGSATTLTLSSDGQTCELDVASGNVWYGVATL